MNNLIRGNHERGQVLLIVVLVLVTVVTVGLSLVTRSITNTRIAQEEENSERAFSAAEAGIEQALTSNLGGNGIFVNNQSSYTTAIVPIDGVELLLNNGAPIFKDEGIDISLATPPSITPPVYPTPTTPPGVTRLPTPTSAPTPTLTPTPTPEPVLCVAPPSGLLSWWQAENNGVDSIGGSNATLQLGAGYVTGQDGFAFSFDGIDAKATVPYNARFNLSSQMTIEGWIKPRTLYTNPPGTGLRASYFTNIQLTAPPSVVQIEPTVDHAWSTSAPLPGFSADQYSVRWEGVIMPDTTEMYTFSLYHDDGVRLWVDGERIIDNWGVYSPIEHSASKLLEAGRQYSIKLEYFENYERAYAQLRWSSPSTPKEIIPQSNLAPDPQEYMTIVAKSTLPTTRNYGLWVRNGGLLHLAFYDQSGANTALDSPMGAISDNEWQHVAVTINWGAGGSMRMYINGALVASRAITTSPRADTSPLTIGNENNRNIPFPGAVDELSIYNRALSAAEIQSIYNAQSYGKCGP